MDLADPREERVTTGSLELEATRVFVDLSDREETLVTLVFQDLRVPRESQEIPDLANIASRFVIRISNIQLCFR